MPLNGPDLLVLRSRILDKFTSTDWKDIALVTDTESVVNGHDRLLRSLYFGDEDYAGNIVTVLRQIEAQNPAAMATIQKYLDQTYPDAEASTYVSARPSARRITFAPAVFDVPDYEVEGDLVAVMMPFSAEFGAVYEAIKTACNGANLRCLRADDIWDESTFIQDIFNLIFRARVVVVDFTDKNPNVMYETGIAHTLGKNVIPISQNFDDVPSDTKHHRYLKYLHNTQGLSELSSGLQARLLSVSR